MFALNSKNIIIIGVVGAVILGGIYFYLSGGFSLLGQNQKGQKGETAFEPEITSIAGKVVSVDEANNSFVVLLPKEDRQFTVKLGESTAFIRLVFPFDVANPPASATFTPERKIITIKDLAENDQVFVRASSPIRTKQDIINPLEVQILP